MRLARQFALSTVLALSAAAQSAPTYTAVYSSDSMHLYAPALSPDGHWVAFSLASRVKDDAQLVVVPAGGGAPIAITQGEGSFTHPVWFPRSDAIAFISSRADGGIVVQRLDAGTGHPVGDAQRVTIESAQPVGLFDVSPDGKRLAYAVGTPGNMTIKTVSTSGGPARDLVHVDAGVPQVLWTSDNTIEYGAHRDPGGTYTVYRISAQGGTPSVVATYRWTEGFIQLGRTFALRGAVARQNGDTLGIISVVSRSGDTLTRFDSRGARVAGGLNNRVRWTPNPNVVMISSAPLRTVVRVSSAGTPPRNVMPASDIGYATNPEGFTIDTKSLYVLDRSSNTAKLMVMPLKGGTARTIPVPAATTAAVPTTDDRYVFTLEGHNRDANRVLSVVNTGTGKAQRISEHVFAGVVHAIRGTNDIVYVENAGSQRVFRRLTAGQQPQTIAAIDTAGLTLSPFNGETFNAHGVVFERKSGDSTRLYVQRGSAPVLVATVKPEIREAVISPDGHAVAWVVRYHPGSSAAFMVQLGEDLKPRGPAHNVSGSGFAIEGVAFSPNGTTLAVATDVTAHGDSSMALHFVNTSTGAIERTVDMPRLARTTESDLLWSRDNVHVFVHAADEPEMRMNIWRIGNVADDRPIALATGEQNQIWDFVLSPDEKTVSYSAEWIPKETIWRIDLPTPAKGARR